MSYHVGVGPGLARRIGIAPREPHVKCDVCGRTSMCHNHRGWAKWALQGHLPRNWQAMYNARGQQLDVCPHCVRTKLYEQVCSVGAP